MSKSIIPRDLKPGDRLWYSRYKHAVIGDDVSWIIYRPMNPESIHAWDALSRAEGQSTRDNGTCVVPGKDKPDADEAVGLPDDMAAAVNAAHDGPISDEQVGVLLYYLRAAGDPAGGSRT